MQRRKHLQRFAPAQARRLGQPKGGGNAVEVVAHLQIGIIDRIVDAVGSAPAQGSQAGRGQIVGMNVVGEYIVVRRQGRQAFVQALHRQAVGGVDAGRAQNADRHPAPRPPSAQYPLGIDPTLGAGAFRLQAPCLINHCAATITVNPRRAYVNQAAW